MKPYIHKVQYYETDKMGITHHSNYIRWMEEARVDFLEQIGWGYDRMEECGIISPVISVECAYQKPTTFNDRIRVEIRVEGYTGVKLTLKYIMQDIYTEEIVALGESKHCFLSEEGKPVTLWKQFPELDNVLKIGLKSEE
ncbi:MAG: acyl-CoA thioesterase [Lachnospiraceae bacterium]|nr:acyl-CoA thioesterase [Lachnospiraceae bacterium]